MHADAVLDLIARELLAGYGVHAIALYGSRADGSAGPDSDYDIAAFGPVAEPLRIPRLEVGAYLDVFVYSQHEPVAHEAFGTALEPGASNGAIASLVELVVGSSDPGAGPKRWSGQQ